MSDMRRPSASRYMSRKFPSAKAQKWQKKKKNLLYVGGLPRRAENQGGWGVSLCSGGGGGEEKGGKGEREELPDKHESSERAPSSLGRVMRLFLSFIW